MSSTITPYATVTLSPYVSVHHNPDSPVINPVPHAGLKIPLQHIVERHMNLSSEEVQAILNTGVDNCVPDVMGWTRSEDGTIIIPGNTLDSVVVQNGRRAVVDPNRGRTDYDKYSVLGGGDDPRPHGVFWYATLGADGEHRRFNISPYSVEEKEQLLAVSHGPYTHTVEDLVGIAKENHGFAVVFDPHSIWPNRYDIVPDGEFANAYRIGELTEPGSFDDGKLPHLILMNSGGRSCAPEVTDYVLSHFQHHGLIIEPAVVAGKGYQLPRNDIADPENGIHAFSIEIVGFEGLEPERAQGKLTFQPNPAYLERLQTAFAELNAGLRTGKFRR